MAKAVVTFVSDSADVMSAIDKMNKKLAELEEKNKKLSDNSKRSALDAKAGIDATVGSLGRMITGYLSVQTVIQGLNRELEHRNNLEKGYLDLQKTTAASEREYIRNLGIVSEQQRQAALAGLRGVSERTGVPLQDLYGAGAFALSASGGDAEIANAAVEQAARIAPEDARAMQMFAGAIIDLGKASKTLDPKRGLELLIGMQATSRVADIASLAAYAPRGVTGATVAGFTPEEGAALFDTMSNAMADREGATTATAISTMAARMRAFGAKRGMKDATGREVFDRISGDDSMRRAFLEDLRESETKPFVELLITPGTKENALFKNLAKSKMQGGNQAEQFIAGLNTTELQGTAASARSIEAVKERYGVQQTKAANEALIRQMFVDLMDKTGQGGMTGYPVMWQYDLRKISGTESGADQLERELASQEQYIRFGGPGTSGVERPTSEFSKMDKDLLEYFKSMRDDLKAIRENQRNGDPKTNRAPPSRP